MTIWEHRAKTALRIATSSAVSHYLMSNAHGRQDGYEKAMAHLALCAIFVATFRNIDPERAGRDFAYDHDAVHTATQKLTSYMDREIGFPLDSDPDYAVLEPLFFDKFYEIAVKILTKKSPKNRSSSKVLVLDTDNPLPYIIERGLRR